MDRLRDEYGNPVRQTDEFGNPVQHKGTMGAYDTGTGNYDSMMGSGYGAADQGMHTSTGSGYDTGVGMGGTQQLHHHQMPHDHTGLTGTGIGTEHRTGMGGYDTGTHDTGLTGVGIGTGHRTGMGGYDTGRVGVGQKTHDTGVIGSTGIGSGMGGYDTGVAGMGGTHQLQHEKHHDTGLTGTLHRSGSSTSSSVRFLSLSVLHWYII